MQHARQICPYRVHEIAEKRRADPAKEYEHTDADWDEEARGEGVDASKIRNGRGASQNQHARDNHFAGLRSQYQHSQSLGI